MRRMTVTLPQMMVAIPTMMLVLAMAVMMMMMMMVRTCHGVGDDDTDSMLVGTRK